MLLLNPLSHSILATVDALLVPTGTIFFKPLEVRVLFKRGYYSRAGTIEKFPKFGPRFDQFSVFRAIFMGKWHFLPKI